MVLTVKSYPIESNQIISKQRDSLIKYLISNEINKQMKEYLNEIKRDTARNRIDNLFVNEDSTGKLVAYFYFK